MKSVVLCCVASLALLVPCTNAQAQSEEVLQLQKLVYELQLQITKLNQVVAGLEERVHSLETSKIAALSAQTAELQKRVQVLEQAASGGSTSEGTSTGTTADPAASLAAEAAGAYLLDRGYLLQTLLDLAIKATPGYDTMTGEEKETTYAKLKSEVYATVETMNGSVKLAPDGTWSSTLDMSGTVSGASGSWWVENGKVMMKTTVKNGQPLATAQVNTATYVGNTITVQEQDSPVALRYVKS